MKILFFITVLFISSSLAQDGEFIQLLCSFTEDSVEADAAAEGWNAQLGTLGQITLCGGTLLSFQDQLVQNLFTGIPPHDQVKIEYESLCSLGASVGTLMVDNVVEVEFSATIDNAIGIRNCAQDGSLIGDAKTVSEIVDHTSPNMLLEIHYTTICLIWDVKISYRALSSGTDPDPQDCFDHLGTTMDGEGNVLITNSCDPFIQDGEQRFQFTTMFLEPYVFNDDCLDIEVWFQDTLLREGDGEIDQWSFDGETQKIIWNLNFSDFSDKYNCEDGEIGFQLFWKCDFSVKLLFDGEIQLEYTSKIQVLVDTMLTGSLVVNVQKNVVEGVCCENQLNIDTELLFCTDMSCDTFADSPLTIVRKESFFVCHRIVNPEFQGFYLKFLQAQLDEFIPSVIKYDSSEPGKLILELQSNVAKNDMVLSVISQLHKNPLMPDMGGSGSGRFLQEDRISKAKQDLQNNEYRVAGYEQISVLYASDIENIKQENEVKVSSSSSGNDKKLDSGNEQEDRRDQKTSMYMIILVASLFLCCGLVYILVKYNLKQKKNKKLRDSKYKESQQKNTEQELQQSQ